MSSNLSSKPEEELRPWWDTRLGYHAYRRAIRERAQRRGESSTPSRGPRRSKRAPLPADLVRRLESHREWARKRERRRWRFPKRVHLCESGRVRARWRRLETGEEFETEYRCGSFRCRRCGRRRGLNDADDIRAVLEAWEREGQAAAFIVLTFPRRRFREGCWGRMQCWETLPRAWNRLRHRLRRRGLLGAYFTVMEAHRDGWPHVNLVMAGALGEVVKAGRWREVRRILVREAKASGFGFEVWVSREPAGRQLAGYLAKYLTKPEQVPVQGPVGLHRIRYARDCLRALREARCDRDPQLGESSGLFAFCGLWDRDLK